MATRLNIVLLALALASQASAWPGAKCTSMCHFFDAWSLTQLCANLAFNENGVFTDKAFGDLRIMKRRALKFDRAARAKGEDICHPACMKDSDDDKAGTPCEFLKERH